MTDYGELRAKAMAAKQGEWSLKWESEYGELNGGLISRYPTGVFSDDGATVLKLDDDYGPYSGRNAAYVAAASPSVVLALLDELEPTEATALQPSAAVREFLDASDEHWRYLMGKEVYTFSLLRLEKARENVRKELGL